MLILRSTTGTDIRFSIAGTRIALLRSVSLALFYRRLCSHVLYRRPPTVAGGVIPVQARLVHVAAGAIVGPRPLAPCPRLVVFPFLKIGPGYEGARRSALGAGWRYSTRESVTCTGGIIAARSWEKASMIDWRTHDLAPSVGTTAEHEP